MTRRRGQDAPFCRNPQTRLESSLRRLSRDAARGRPCAARPSPPAGSAAPAQRRLWPAGEQEGATSPGFWLEDCLSRSVPKQASLTTSPGDRSSRGTGGPPGPAPGPRAGLRHRSAPRGVRARSPAPGRPGFAAPCDRLAPQLCPCGDRDRRGLGRSSGPVTAENVCPLRVNTRSREEKGELSGLQRPAGQRRPPVTVTTGGQAASSARPAARRPAACPEALQHGT